MGRIRIPTVTGTPRKLAVRAWLWAGLLAYLTLSGCTREAPRRPDLVLITVDAANADAFRCFSDEEERNRSFCQLARGGTLFTWAMSSGQSLASSAATALTGVEQAVHGIDGGGVRFLLDAEETLAERLRAEGYATAAFVENPRLNASTRLDQGFDVYDAPIPGQTETAQLPERVRSWLGSIDADRPMFLWIHIATLAPAEFAEDRNESHSRTAALRFDRTLARLEGILNPNHSDERQRPMPATLITALRGESTDTGMIRLDSHRIPLLWRPASNTSLATSEMRRDTGRRSSRPAPPPPRESRALTSLIDIALTLIEAARIPIDSNESPDTSGGFTLTRAAENTDPRFLLLRSHTPQSSSHTTRSVGIASGRYVYVRSASPYDASGRPIPTKELETYAPRFVEAAVSVPRTELGRLPWRGDALSADSPVPRLEFHLAQRLRTQPASESH